MATTQQIKALITKIRVEQSAMEAKFDTNPPADATIESVVLHHLPMETTDALVAEGRATAYHDVIATLEDLLDQNRDPENPFDPSDPEETHLAPSDAQVQVAITKLKALREEMDRHSFQLPEKPFIAGQIGAVDEVVRSLQATLA